MLCPVSAVWLQVRNSTGEGGSLEELLDTTVMDSSIYCGAKLCCQPPKNNPHRAPESRNALGRAHPGPQGSTQCWHGCVADLLGCASLEQLLGGLFVLVAIKVVLMAEERGGGVFTRSMGW